MKQLAAVLLFTLALACGGGTDQHQPPPPPPCPSTQPGCPGYVAPDYAASYVSAWTGPATFVVNSTSSTSTIKVPISEVSSNVIKLHGFCSPSDAYSDGPDADVTSSGFTVRGGGSCTASTTSCSTFTFGVSGGTGSLSNGVVTLNIYGTVTCNGTSMSYTASFTSQQQATYGSLVASGGGNEAAAGALEALSASF